MPVTITMKANGPTINVTVKEQCTGLQVMKNMKETGKIISKVDLALIFGLTVQQIINSLETDMLAIGLWVRDTVKVPFTIQMVVNMKETGKKTSNTVKEFLHLKMELNMMVLLRMIE